MRRAQRIGFVLVERDRRAEQLRTADVTLPAQWTLLLPWPGEDPFVGLGGLAPDVPRSAEQAGRDPPDDDPTRMAGEAIAARERYRFGASSATLVSHGKRYQYRDADGPASSRARRAC